MICNMRYLINWSDFEMLVKWIKKRWNEGGKTKDGEENSTELESELSLWDSIDLQPIYASLINSPVKA